MESQDLESLLNNGIEIFKNIFKSTPTIAVCSPTKANIIGEHIDYNDGIILSIGIPLYMIVLGTKNDLNKIRAYTTNNDIQDDQKLIEFQIPSIEPLTRGGPEWGNYIKGTIELFKGYILEGFDIIILSKIPSKVGLLSSSVLCIVVYTFLEAFTKEITTNLRDKAHRCMKAEEKFTDKKINSIMDIYAIISEKENFITNLDCRDMRAKYIPYESRDVSVLIINSNKQCTMDEIELESRRKYCKEAAKIMGLNSLRDAKTNHFKAFRVQLLEDKERDMRARHVHSEIKRVERSIQALISNDFKLLGKLMNQSQTSLKYDCEVSIQEIDEIIEIVLEINGVYGAKMFGPGLGGCIIVLLKSTAVDEVVVATKRKYAGKAEFYLADPAKTVTDISFMIFNLERKAIKVMRSVSTQLEYAVELFSARFNRYPEIAVQAPGRVTILGEHTYPHNGFILQMAIPLTTIIVGRKNCSNFFNIYVDEDFTGEEDDFLSLTLPIVFDLRKETRTWTNLIYGVVKKFKGQLKQGFDIVMVSTIPDAAGLGRDSSVIVAFYTFLELITQNQTPNWIDKAKICHDAEKEFTHNETSYSDYLTIISAQEGKLTYIDCLTEEMEMIPFQKDEFMFLLTALPDEKIIPDDKFPDRVIECSELVQVLGIETLREADVQMLDDKQDCMTYNMYKRGNYIIQEMIRTYEAKRAIEHNDYESLGAILLQSHNSLRYHFDHSTPNLNQIVALTMKCPGVLGTKITSSEQSRCTLTLLRRKSMETVIDRIHCGYKPRTLFYSLEPKDGAQNITESLNLELRRRNENVEVISDYLEEETIASTDLNELSWSMFDLGEEWANWEAQRKKYPQEHISGESLHESSFKDTEEGFPSTIDFEEEEEMLPEEINDEEKKNEEKKNEEKKSEEKKSEEKKNEEKKNEEKKSEEKKSEEKKSEEK